MASHPAIIGRRRLDTESLRVGSNFWLAWVSLLKQTLNGPTLCHSKVPFLGVFGAKVNQGFNWDSLAEPFTVEHRPPTCFAPVNH